MAEPLKFTKYQRQSKRKPLELEMPNGETVTIPVPNGGVVLDIEEAGTARKILKLVCGEDNWRRIQPLLRELEDPEAVREFTKDVMSHFGLAADDIPE